MAVSSRWVTNLANIHNDSAALQALCDVLDSARHSNSLTSHFTMPSLRPEQHPSLCKQQGTWVHSLHNAIADDPTAINPAGL